MITVKIALNSPNCYRDNFVKDISFNQAKRYFKNIFGGECFLNPYWVKEKQYFFFFF